MQTENPRRTEIFTLDVKRYSADHGDHEDLKESADHEDSDEWGRQWEPAVNSHRALV